MAIIFFLVMVQLHLAIGFVRAAKRAAPSAALPATSPATLPDGQTWPRVAVQLPVYNEVHVVERLLDAVLRLDYPAGLLEVQILDDSTDDTTAVIARKLRAFRDAGIEVSHLRREDRQGFKAGALAAGLERTDAEFVAIFDADFVPRPDFLKRTLVGFTDDRIALVQSRWGYLNEDQSFLTRIYVFMLNLHFAMEQTGRYARGYFGHFNGTAGIWRREAIQDAGGWRDDSLTEDLDLSFRAQFRGWRIVYLNDYRSPSEVPPDMPGIRSQQRRWIKGGAECARLHLGAVLRSGLPPVKRLHAAAHLVASSVYAVVLVAILVSVPLSILKNTAIETDYAFLGAPLTLSTCCMAWVYWVSQEGKYNRGIRGWLRFAGLYLTFLVFSLGLTVQNGLAAIEGWLARRSAFIRTPKHGGGADGVHWTRNDYVAPRVDAIVLAEAAVALAMLATVAVSLYYGEYWLAPFQLMVAAGLSGLVWLSVSHALRLRRARRAPPGASQSATPRPTLR